ncbi:hypothetical protein QBC38DRAFT_25931 [Podospora fimiseda]|uniref:Fungal N-terminal domain-containing protein n=1 Tax=Podospora fimiseda TaxID=252190 RepID=A0AAN7BIX2_9PEZI|nr:hypothetical protein QBC38DRAFT_25931 [Podospora fimiseda]
MADPISLVGLTAGLVSLGLQISEGAFKFIDALKCRKEEIASTRRQVDDFKSLITSIETAAQQFQTGYPTIKIAVLNCINSCKTELTGLESFLVELIEQDPSTTGLRAHLKSHGKKLVYPFERPKIEKLEKTLDSANGKLLLVLQTLGIQVASSANGKLSTIEGEIRDTKDLQYLHHAKLMRQALITNHTQFRQLGELAVIRKENALNTTRHADVARELELFRQETRQSLKLITGRLVSKPGALKEICDAADMRKDLKISGQSTTSLVVSKNHYNEQFQAIMSSFGASASCFCRPRQRLEQKVPAHNSLFSFFVETAIMEQHLPGCSAGRANSKEQRKEYVLVYNGLRRVLNSAIRISFAMHTGAGAWSITPTFKYYPTVDPNDAPAFRIMKFISDVVNWRPRTWEDDDYERRVIEENAQEWPKLVALAFSKVVLQLRKNKISPLAIDSQKRSLLHYAAEAMNCILRSDLSDDPTGRTMSGALFPLLQVFKELVSYNVPACDYDIEGRAPLALTIPGFDYCPLVFQDLVDVVFPTTNDIRPLLCSLEPCQQPYLESSVFGIWRCMEVLKSSPKVAEAEGCGDLSLAILANDSVKVQKYLERHPEMLNERTLMGQSPLHLACDKPSILRLLLKHTTDPELLNHVDSEGRSAFEWAFAVSGKFCVNQTRNMCSRCRCAEATLLFLRAGSIFGHNFLRKLQLFLNFASQRCKKRFIQHLKKRREELKDLAILHLLPSEVHDLRLQSGGVLDAAVPQVVSLLQRRGVIIPPALSLPEPCHGNSPAAYPIYQNLQEVDDAELFFRAGFHDMDVFLLEWPGFSISYLPDPVLLYMQWLDNHRVGFLCEPLKLLNSIQLNTFNAHAICCGIGRRLNTWFGDNLEKPKDDWVTKLNTTALSRNLADQCECKCSIEGCLPFLYLLKGMEEPFMAPDCLADMFICYLGHLGAGVDVNHHYAALRYNTYTVLGLPHICCDLEKGLNNLREPRYSPEEVEEIYSEHAACLGLFEDLLEEFEEQINRIFAIPAEDRLPILVHFWRCPWVRRIEEVLGQLEGDALTEQEKLGAERVGVIWDSERSMDEPEPSPNNPHDPDTWEYWFYELNQIP